jgi:hypothetical protein
MKSNTRGLFSLIAIGAMALFTLVNSSVAADLSPADKQFLAGYEKIHVALVADDLASAKSAAAALGTPGADLGNSKSLDEARASFSKLSDAAEKLAAGQPGYYVLHCGMVNKDWVQTSPQPANPYAGKDMAGCGEVKTQGTGTSCTGSSCSMCK